MRATMRHRHTPVGMAELGTPTMPRCGEDVGAKWSSGFRRPQVRQFPTNQTPCSRTIDPETFKQSPDWQTYSQALWQGTSGWERARPGDPTAEAVPVTHTHTLLPHL